MHEPTADPGTHDADVAALTAWLERTLGCTEVTLHRQRRWRPVWRAEVTQNGVRRELLLKGDRTWPTHPHPLDYEMRMQRTLHENGMPIPAILGMCPEPNTIVMEWVRGGRDPGLIQEAIANPSSMSADRWEASLRYMDILADMHRIPPDKFVAEGAVMPDGEREIALNSFERFHEMTRTTGITDPLIEFCSRWLRRNVPAGRTAVSFLTATAASSCPTGPRSPASSTWRSAIWATPCAISPAIAADTRSRTWATSPPCSGATKPPPDSRSTTTPSPSTR